MNHKIFVCEDEVIIATDIINNLKKWGFDDITYFKTAEALQKSIEKDKPDLIISDIQTPGAINGLEAARVAVVLHPLIKIILLSANLNAYDFTDEEKEKMIFISKPYNIQKLSDAIQEIKDGIITTRLAI
jgi:two-component SAPR family response regulator